MTENYGLRLEEELRITHSRILLTTRMDGPPAHLAFVPDLPQKSFRNALVVGVTQSGKSTFLNTVAQHCGVAASHAVGDGLFSCTKTCAIQKFTTYAKSCNIPTGKDGDSPDKILEQFFDNDSYEAVVEEHKKLQFNVTLIDTPGLDDSDGNDETVITEIAQAIQQQESLSCVVLVLKKTTTFTATVREKIKYYLQLLQNYQSSVLIVHTAWSPLEEDYTNQKRKRQEIIEMELGGVRATHFFIDLVVATDRRNKPWIEHCKALRSDALNSILSHISNCEQRESKDVLIPKTAWLTACDDKLKAALDAFRASTKSTLGILDSNLKTLVPKVESFQSSLSSAELKRANIESHLAQLDVQTEVEVAAESATINWQSISWKKSKEVTVVAPCEITNTIYVADTPWTTWKRATIKGNTAVATCESSYFQGCYGRLIALAPSRNFYANKIVMMNSDKAAAETEAQKMRVQLLKAKLQDQNFVVQMRHFEGRIHSLTALLNHASQDRVSIPHYVALLEIYKHDAIKEIIDAYCRFLKIENFFTEAPVIFKDLAMIEGVFEVDQVSYGILEKIGQGGFGVIWKAVDISTGTKVAIKESVRGFPGLNPSTEYQALQKLNKVPRVPKLISARFGQLDIQIPPSLVLEYVPGVNADVYFEKIAPASQGQLASFLILTLRTLQGVHEAGVIHRDIKPLNIKIHEDSGEPWLLDFGAASLSQQGKQTPLGTGAFMAPESWTGNVGPYSDIYSLGVTLISLTNQLTDEDDAWFQVLERCRFTPGFRTIILGMIENDYRERFQTCKEILVALNNLGITIEE